MYAGDQMFRARPREAFSGYPHAFWSQQLLHRCLWLWESEHKDSDGSFQCYSPEGCICFLFFLFFNILLEYLEGKNHLGSEKTAKYLAALMDFMLLNQKFILLFAFLTLRSNYINYSNLSVIYIVN